MNNDIAVPVKNLVKTWTRGSKLAKKFGKSASTVSAEEALDISESVDQLQRSLDRHSEAVATVYRRCLESCGEPFARALVDDKSIQSELKELRADLMDQINEIQDVADEPEDFEADIFINVQKESEEISSRCIRLLENARDGLGRTNPQEVPLERDDRASLTSMRTRGDSTSTEASISTTVAPLRIIKSTVDSEPGSPLKPPTSWTFDSTATTDPTSDSKAASSRPLADQIPISTNPEDFISSAAVELSFQANSDFLERRRLSRLAFQSESRKSVLSIEEDKQTVFSDFGSPVLSPVEARPVDGRMSRASSDGYPAYLNGQRSPYSPSERKRLSTASSQYTIGSNPRDRSSISSQRPPPGDDFFGQAPPQSDAGSLRDRNSVSSQRPPPGDGVFGQVTSQSDAGSLRDRNSVSSQRPPPGDGVFGQAPSQSEAPSSRDSAALAATLKIPGYGQGVEDGLEAVDTKMVDRDNEKYFVSSHEPIELVVSASSVKSVDSPIRHDTSFYKFGGFCEGAATVLRGELGYKIVKRPRGTYGSQDFAKCIKCAYEVPMGQIEKDLKMDVSGIYGNSGIRWRQQFLTKCHLKTSTAEDTMYGCLFCIEDRKTPEEHDATVFFSYKQLFDHLARHTRPLAKVPGINMLYGRIDPSFTNFDLHFIRTEPTPSTYNSTEIAPLVAVRPSGFAISTYHPRHSVSSSKDPDGNPTLHFAVGARIVGITFPEHFGGAWCQGYHDGEKGSFPAAAIVLDLPAKEDIFMSPQSPQFAFAKWEFKPRDAKDGGWLKFSRGDKISHIGYTFPDQWCWSGQTKNGKWGLFPASFVEELSNGAEATVGSPVSGKSGLMGFRKFGSRSGSFPISRSSRSGSVKSSNGSTKVPSVKPTAGLEVIVNGVVM